MGFLSSKFASNDDAVQTRQPAMSCSLPFRLTRFLKPGWYRQTHSLHQRYYFSVDYDRSILTVDLFSTRVTSSAPPVSLAVDIDSEPLAETERWLTLLGRETTPMDPRDFLYYQYPVVQPPFTYCVCFWIGTREKTVYWAGRQYPLQDNQCRFDNITQSLTLTFEDSNRVTLKCPYQERPRYHEKVCLCPQEKPLFPFSFQTYPENEATRQVPLPSSPLNVTPDTPPPPSEEEVFSKSKQIVYPSTRIIFTQIPLPGEGGERDNVTVVTQWITTEPKKFIWKFGETHNYCS